MILTVSIILLVAALLLTLWNAAPDFTFATPAPRLTPKLDGAFCCPPSSGEKLPHISPATLSATQFVRPFRHALFLLS